MNQNLSALNNRFAIEDRISFHDPGDECIIADITNRHCSASIALQGAHLLSWIPAGQQPVIWMSDDARLRKGKSIRGGIPVCWPWFGAHDPENSFPAHGFARTSMWNVTTTELLADDSCRISFKLAVAANPPLWPHATQCELHVTLGATLDMQLITTNRSDEAITVSQALHTYFAVSDIRSVSLLGLDGCPYLDKPDDFKRKQQHGPVIFNDEVDRIYLDTTDDCLIKDPVHQRSIRIAKAGSASTIVWNPWQQRADAMGDMGDDGYLTMLCVESANAADDRIEIQPESSHTLSIRYSIEYSGT